MIPIPPILVLSESTPSDPAVRCKVYEAVLKRSPPGLRDNKIESVAHDQRMNESDGTVDILREPPAEQKRKSSRQPTVILGPLPTMRMELSSSSASAPSSPSPGRPSPSKVARARSTSDANLRPSRSNDSYVSHTRTTSHRGITGKDMALLSESERIDWVEYSKAMTNVESKVPTEATGWSRSETSWNAVRSASEVVIVNDRARSMQPTQLGGAALETLLEKLFGSKELPIVRPPYKLKTPPHHPRPTAPPQTPIRHLGVRGVGRPVPRRTPPSPLTQMRERASKLPPVKADPRETSIESKPESTDTESSVSGPGAGCAACGRKCNSSYWATFIPCGHVMCSKCCSASIAAVSVTQGASKCLACQEDCFSFERLPGPPTKKSIMRDPEELHGDHTEVKQAKRDETIVLRIDNVAWDITPDIVIAFLPRDVVPKNHPQPIHILLDRFDGRTKDYMYVEVVSTGAARKVLKKRQNAFMPAGVLHERRKRPVTISQVSHQELLQELRPRSSKELYALLALCQAAVTGPSPHDPLHPHPSSHVSSNGLAHFVKSRHGPFYALMSILTKLHGQDSAAYWDLFQVTSGAIAALATATNGGSGAGPFFKRTTNPTDREVLNKLRFLFNTTFGLVPTLS